MCLSVSRAYNLEKRVIDIDVDAARQRKGTPLFQSGCVEMAESIPNPIPMNVSPVVCVLNPCTSSKIMGNAWNARYRIPRTRAFLKDQIRTYVECQ